MRVATTFEGVLFPPPPPLLGEAVVYAVPLASCGVATNSTVRFMLGSILRQAASRVRISARCCCTPEEGEVVSPPLPLVSMIRGSSRQSQRESSSNVRKKPVAALVGTRYGCGLRKACRAKSSRSSSLKWHESLCASKKRFTSRIVGESSGNRVQKVATIWLCSGRVVYVRLHVASSSAASVRWWRSSVLSFVCLSSRVSSSPL